MIDDPDRIIPQDPPEDQPGGSVLPQEPPEEALPGGAEEDEAGYEVKRGADAVNVRDGNDYFRMMMDRNFLEYASYVIKDRAIPDVDDGLKPVQRRILWALYKNYDGRTDKVSNIVGNVMHYHPHGDASIKDALVTLANKDFFIVKQGNFGNPLTGSPAAAGRYIECALSKLGKETLFDNDITEFVDTYDGRGVEPVTLPALLPVLLMQGADGIAVGMATRIMPHNFVELLNAQKAILRDQPFELYPDFPTGGLMDAKDYDDGNGRIVVNARIDIEGRRLIIRELPAGVTSEAMVASIERAAEKNKIKISGVNDYTTDRVEIEVIPTRGYDPEKTRSGLYMYTLCSMPISVNMTVIRDSRPARMTVSEVLRRNTGRLVDYLRRKLEIALGRKYEEHHARTLAQIFFEERIYKRIEECGTQEAEFAEVRAGLAPFTKRLRREISDEDIDRLLALPVRRISRFDINKNQSELAAIEADIRTLKAELADIKGYAVKFLDDIIARYGSLYPRRTEIVSIAKIDRVSAALNNIKVGFDRKNGYVGTQVKSDVTVVVNEFDKLQCLERSGRYRIIPIPEKIFIGKLADFRRFDASAEYGVIYRESRSGKCYGKRCRIDKFITEKQYELFPPGARLELFTPRADAIYELAVATKKGSEKTEPAELNLMELPLRSSRARGVLISNGREVKKITHLRYLEPEELAAYASAPEPEAESEMEEPVDGAPAPEVPEAVAEPKPAPEPEPEPEPEVPEAIAEPKPAPKPAPEPEPVPEPEPAAEIPKSTSKPEPAPEPEPVPEPEPEPEVTESSPEPEAPEAAAESGSKAPQAAPGTSEYLIPEAAEAGPARKGRKKSSGHEAGKKEKNGGKIAASEDDGLGIVQPEFGF